MRTIAGYGAAEERFTEGTVDLFCYRVADLEEIVDREALLGADEIAEPPYWAHLWIGATALARHLAGDDLGLEGKSVLDLGCGVGLPGLVAAARGAIVDFADYEAAALAFVAASLERNGLNGRVLTLDFTREPPPRCYDLVIGAEIVYQPSSYAPLAAFLDAALAPGGALLLSDAFRADAATVFAALEARGLRGRKVARRVWEDGRPHPLFLWTFER